MTPPFGEDVCEDGTSPTCAAAHGAWSGLAFCIPHPSDNAADLSVVEAEVVTDLLERIAAARVGGGDGLVADWVHRDVVLQWLGQRSPLDTGNVRQISIPRQPPAQALDEGLRPEEDLMPQLLPGAGLTDVFGDEATIGRDRRLHRAIEGGQQPVQAQPIRAGHLTRGGTVTDPRPIVRCCDHPRADRIQYDVAR